MFGNKLKAWMEAVRPKKKNYRRDKQGTKMPIASENQRPNNNSNTNHIVPRKSNCLLDNEKKEVSAESSKKKYSSQPNKPSESQMRYSATTLSSPESAYSTGYSTDGTSPGGAPPDYPIKNVKAGTEKPLAPNPFGVASSRAPQDFSDRISSPAVVPKECLKGKCYTEDTKVENPLSTTQPIFLSNPTEQSGLLSPRQRNRIRTNPWLPGGANSTISSPLPIRQETKVTPVAYRNIKSPYIRSTNHRKSISSSSCSSLSAGLNQSFEHRFSKSLSDDEDYTLNEMMGKYDESYIYEKETDILSDSNPTDCESDIDTGQDGGDEEDDGDEEFDFIDNGSYVEINNKIHNAGHCMYILPEIQRKRSSRRRMLRKGKEQSEKRRKSSNKKQKHVLERSRYSHSYQDGSKSAGATPLVIRRSSLKTSHQNEQEEFYKQRSNSVCLQKNITTVLIDKRDREADMKYKELIGQAKQIIRTMNINGLSPRRLPGLANKRVELLRVTECAKSELGSINKQNESISIPPNSNAPPSNITFRNTRFSPRKNHITNFIINNSPVLLKKELHTQSSPMSRRKVFPENHSPLPTRRLGDDLAVPPSYLGKQNSKEHFDGVGSPFNSRRSHKPRGILQPASTGLFTHRHRRETELPVDSSSSDEEGFHKFKKSLSKSCPQSEPMKRKVYFVNNSVNAQKNHGKTVGFNLNEEVGYKNTSDSSENLRHQVLLNTIQSLKRNLENHSASLQQVYNSSQSIYNKH
ncbi:uncharacterized protein LOC126748317 isoform X2 [Anthonomus grandis grandis]|uniref:uncharacterized protein LOC126748317 isoform X2 n=1 Tax=Anthonomus grandis grandis TaxID=2921223 RepID=UPI0021654F13|nr:uncharacterized protein LOC126748317 isoform X2 [Anthonomus grandis grandis]